MIHYEDDKPMKNVTPAELSKAEAKKLTQKIKTAVDELWPLFTKAHEGKAWKALGYLTWEAYVKAEFGMGRSRAYQLLDKGEVIQAIADATGTDVQRVGQISARDVEAVKDDLPAVTEQIKAKVDAGEVPSKAVAETVAAARAAKEKAKAEKTAQQAENDRQREEHAAALPDAIKQREQAKAEAIAARKVKPADADALTAENEELREANAALETELAAVKADNANWEGMRVQFELGGFEKVIAGKDEEIRVLETRLYRESADKASWMRLSKYWQEEAKKLGFSNDTVIDIETGEVVDG
ncbi:hypothetical protein [Mesorhizobium sp. A556]